MTNQWNSSALQSRIKNLDQRVTYGAGSPGEAELDCYRELVVENVRSAGEKANALVLGMTGGLRVLLHDLGCNVTCIDRSQEAIELLGGWVGSELAEQEQIVQGEWLDLPKPLGHSMDVIMGDGVFANVLATADQVRLLASLKETLKPGGAMVLRKILRPRGFERNRFDPDALLAMFRGDKICEADFGFGMRIWGCYELAYDESTCLLDSAIVFDHYQGWADEGKLSSIEYSIIERYLFRGQSSIPEQDAWEGLVCEAGFDFERVTLEGKLWYEYYPLYRIWPS